MSIYNRKMFKRNARNALNNSAGVQNFFNGGQINVRGRIPGARPVFASQAARVGGPSRSFGVARDGRVFTFPTTANTMSGALDLGIATKATGLPFRDFDKLDPKSPRYDPNVQKGGLGSLTVPEAASLAARQGGFAARQRAEDRFGKGSGIASAADVLGQLAGGAVGGTTQALATADTPDQDTIGGRLAGMTPSEDYLKSLGINVMDVRNRAGSQGGRSAQDVANLQAQQYQRAVDAADRNAGAVRPTTPDSPPFTDQQAEVREREDEAAKAAGEAYFDEKLGIMRPGTDPEIQRLLNEEAQRAQNEAAVTEDSDIEKQERGDFDPEVNLDVSEEGGANDAAAAIDITPPSPRPENFEQIVAAAKKTTPDVPDNISPQDAVDIAREKGTGSIEDLKSEFLSLLPKYEEDKSTMGLNIAMMGFAIAGGESKNALTNIANGMKKTLPALIRSKEKKKAFERETELLAAKYAIARTEDDRKQDRLKNTYFVTEAFTDPTTGQEYESGQMVRLNDKAFEIAEKSGLTKKLTTAAIMQKKMEADAKAAEGMGYKEINALYDRVSREFKGQKYEVLVPSAYGRSQGITNSMLASNNDLPTITNQYVNQLDKIHALDKGIQTALGLVGTGEATGGKAVIGRLFDGLKGAGLAPTLKAVGFKDADIDKLSTAGQYERLHGVLAMQLAPILLGEAGKTISDADRVRVAQALGYEAQLVNNNAIINLTGGAPKLFQSQADAAQSLQLIQEVLRNRARETHGEYKTFATSIGLPFEERKAAANTQDALTAGSGFNVVLGDDNVYDLVPIG